MGLRLPQLEQRPMHGDEAIHAVKFGLLLEKGLYQYDLQEYHGPTLNYITLISAWLSSTSRFSDLNEFTLRIIPVIFGLLLVVLPFLLVKYFSKPAAFTAALITAISPAMVFYSRYYIQEILLVCFTFGAITSGFFYLQKRHFRWVLLTGIFLGLMLATKETSIILFCSLILALWLTLFVRKLQENPPCLSRPVKRKILWHSAATIFITVSVSALFYSSFLSNFEGVVDSYKTFSIYFNRTTQNEWHIHPWFYYIKMLLFSKYSSGLIWSEAFIIILAIIGMVSTITKKGIEGIHLHLIRFITFFTLFTMVIYSVIPYKTPWNLLGFLYGMILLAGTGLGVIIKLQKKMISRIAVIMLLVMGGFHLTWQAVQANYRYSSDPVNPYVYAHPGRDVFKMVQRIEEISKVHPDKHNMYIQVICSNNDYWPLPWYLRSFPQIGWWNKVDKNVPAASLIIISPEMEKDLIKKLYESPPPGKKHLYVSLFDSYTELRPGVELFGYVRKDLWDRLP